MRNFYELSKKFPPIAVRLLARHPRGAPLTDLEIATKGGLTTHQVSTISWSTSWSGIDIFTMERFLKGSNFDFCNYRQVRRVAVYIREQHILQKLNRSTYRYLRHSPDWKSVYEPMIKLAATKGSGT